MKKIILDTNFLMIPLALKVDIFEEIHNLIEDKYTLYIIDKTRSELNNIIEKQKGKNKQAAIFALKILEEKVPKVIKTEDNGKNVDSEIIDITKDQEYIVATQDRALKSKLKKQDVSLIVLRQKSHLVLI